MKISLPAFFQKRPKTKPNYRVMYVLTVDNEEYPRQYDLHATSSQDARNKVFKRHLEADPDKMSRVLILNIMPL